MSLPTTDHLVFHAATTAEAHQCAYALLKYLDIYNLKPPAHHAVVIYTPEPARLEAYGTFLPQFELKQAAPGQGSLDCLRDFCSTHAGTALYLGEQAYPAAALEPLFEHIRGGQVYAEHHPATGVSLLGFEIKAADSAHAAMEAPFRLADNYLSQYTGLKEFDTVLAAFFERYQEESVPNQVKLAHHLDAAAIQREKARFLRLPLPVRLIRKLTGTGWSIKRVIRKV